MFERQRQSTGRGKGQSRGRENVKQAPCSGQSLTQDSISRPWDHDLSQNQELDAEPTEPSRHPYFLYFEADYLIHEYQYIINYVP